MSFEMHIIILDIWKKEHTSYYNEYVHMPICKKATIDNYMLFFYHAISKFSSVSEQAKYGACNAPFLSYPETSIFI